MARIYGWIILNKDELMAILEKMEFEESYEIIDKCPRCGGKVIRRVRKEPQQDWAGRWYVEQCEEDDCTYFAVGFLPKKYNPREPRQIK